MCADDLVVMHRPSKYGKTDYQPLEEPIPIDLGDETSIAISDAFYSCVSLCSNRLHGQM